MRYSIFFFLVLFLIPCDETFANEQSKNNIGCELDGAYVWNWHTNTPCSEVAKTLISMIDGCAYSSAEGEPDAFLKARGCDDIACNYQKLVVEKGNDKTAIKEFLMALYEKNENWNELFQKDFGVCNAK